MKSFRWTYISAVVIAALVAFTVYDHKRAEKEVEKKEQESSLVRIGIDEVARIEIATRAGSTVLEKKDGEWTVSAPGLRDSADEQAITTLLNQAESEKTVETVVEGAGVDLKPYGLDEPVTRYKISTADGKSQEIKIGSVKAYDNNLYAQVGTEPKVLLVSSGWDVILSKPAKDYRNKKLVRTKLKLDDVKRVVVRQPRLNTAEAQLELAREGDTWKVTKGGEAYPILAEKVASYVDSVQALRAQEVLDGKKTTPGELAKHGLERPTLEVALFTDKAEPVFKASFAENTKKDAGTANAVSSDADDVFLVAKAPYESLKKTAQEFYDKKLPFKFAAADVGRLKVESPEIRGEFVKNGESWSSTDPGLQKEVDSSKLNELVSKLSQMEAARILDAPKKGQARPALKSASRIVLSKASGDPVFELEWGEIVTEKADGGKLERSYRPALTSKTEHRIAVPDGSIKGLELAALVKEKTEPAKPASTPPPPK